MKKFSIVLFAALLGFVACKKDKEDEQEEPKLIFKLKFDPNQQRLDGRGQPAVVPDTHSTQTPDFNAMSAHYIELTPNEYTIPGQGVQVYKGATISGQGVVTIDGDDLDPIDWSKAVVKDEGEVFYEIPLSQVPAGAYEYARVSVTYQNFDIDLRAGGFDVKGTLASFVGYGQYIENLPIKSSSLEVNGIKTQGFWAFEDHLIGNVVSGQAPAGATTVPNPIFSTSEIAEGSCLVTGEFPETFVITGNETEDIEIDLSFSVNQSFEWYDVNGDGIYEPDAGDQVMDMGLRGLVPVVQ